VLSANTLRLGAPNAATAAPVMAAVLTKVRRVMFDFFTYTSFFFLLLFPFGFFSAKSRVRLAGAHTWRIGELYHRLRREAMASDKIGDWKKGIINSFIFPLIRIVDGPFIRENAYYSQAQTNESGERRFRSVSPLL
jgi:hypothetical protein